MEIDPKHFNLLVAKEMHLGLDYEDAVQLVDSTLLGQIAHLADALDYTISLFNDVFNKFS
jgi:hypothetical protein